MHTTPLLLPKKGQGVKNKLRSLWNSHYIDFWLVPGLLVTSGIGLAFITVALDHASHNPSLPLLGQFETGQDAITYLAAIATSAITVVSIIFSITLTALSQVSAQFGSRTVINFIRSTGNQFVLGTFLGTFLYSLLVLRTIYDSGQQKFIPHISLSVSLLLAVIDVGLLIYFIHHVTTSIQAEDAIIFSAHEAMKAITHTFPEKMRSDARDAKKEQGEDSIPADFAQTASTVTASKSGYVQSIAIQKLVQIATNYDLLIRLELRTGNFVVAGDPLVRVWPGKQANGKLSKEINQAFAIGKQHSISQDVDFAINKLVQVALRTLGSSQDPYPAMTCLNWLGVILCHMLERAVPPTCYVEKDKHLRLITRPETFEGVIDTALTPIRRAARSNVAVILQLLNTIETVAAHTTDPKVREALLHHAKIVEQESQQEVPDTFDRQEIKKHYQSLVQKCGEELVDN
jgi:uncharacterized membrane protein